MMVPTARVAAAATTWGEFPQMCGPHREDPAELTTEVCWLLA